MRIWPHLALNYYYNINKLESREASLKAKRHPPENEQTSENFLVDIYEIF